MAKLHYTSDSRTKQVQLVCVCVLFKRWTSVDTVDIERIHFLRQTCGHLLSNQDIIDNTYLNLFTNSGLTKYSTLVTRYLVKINIFGSQYLVHLA